VGAGLYPRAGFRHQRPAKSGLARDFVRRAQGFDHRGQAGHRETGQDQKADLGYFIIIHIFILTVNFPATIPLRCLINLTVCCQNALF